MPWRGRARRYDKEQKQEDFKMHLDVFHFASIEQKNDHISVICTLCDQPSNTLPEHKMHISQKHPYIVNFTQNSRNYAKAKELSLKKMLSVRQIKGRLREIENSSQIIILRQTDQNRVKAKYQGREYEGFRYEKEYNGMEYDETQVYSQLILAPIILNYLTEARYFTMNKTHLLKEDKYQSFPNLITQAQNQTIIKKNLFNPSNKLQSLNNPNNNNSNHFLSNESNLLNPNRSIYHDDESIFKSIGFFAFGNGNGSSMGFKKHDFNLLSINSNSLMDMEPIHSKKPEIKISQCLKSDQKKPLQVSDSKNEQDSRSQPENKGNEQKEGEEMGRLRSRVKTQSLLVSPKPKNNKSSMVSSPSKQKTKKQEKQSQKQGESSKSSKDSLGKILRINKNLG